ncbi:VOC family protein [Dyella sp. A6]|uniref:VOC family protein n=1 Tax=Dyella aluminiiresistens TaxID=3069105 RepID=UPI002E77DA4D|nr:VOC family protein [Dyella sp. A6]
MSHPVCRKATPVLFAPDITPGVAFWRDRLGFEVTTEVPGNNGPAFAILFGHGIEVMYQSQAALAADPHAGQVTWHGDRSYLFVEVDDIDAIASALDGCEILSPRHETFYGAIEIAYREPTGHVVTFAQFKP